MTKSFTVSAAGLTTYYIYVNGTKQQECTDRYGPPIIIDKVLSITELIE